MAHMGKLRPNQVYDSQNGIKNSNGLEHGAEPSRIGFFEYPLGLKLAVSPKSGGERTLWKSHFVVRLFTR